MALPSPFRCGVHVLALVAALALAGCQEAGSESTDPCAEGSLGCACAAGAVCDPGLSCESGRCELAVPTDVVGTDVAPTDAGPLDAEGPDAADSFDAADSVDTAVGPDATASLDLCRPCEDDAACRQTGDAGAHCVRYGDVGSFCGLACESDASCPADYACREVDAVGTGGRVRQCVLANPEALCGCSARAIEAAAETPCAIGDCQGTRVCRADGISACLAADGAVCRPSALVIVSFDSEDGTQCETLAARSGAPYGPLCEPIRSGYTFAGWFVGDDGTGDAVTAETLVATPGDHTLHARWTANVYTLGYDSEGGSACPPRRVIFGAPYGPHCLPEQADLSFVGWTDGDNGTGTLYGEDATVSIAADHTLHAQWFPESASLSTTVTVTFVGNGGTAPSPFTKSVSPGSAYGALATTTRGGFTFVGWFTAATGGTLVLPTTTVALLTNHRLYARWKLDRMDFVTLRGGTFSMGSPSAELGRLPGEVLHSVTLTRLFRLGVTEVTQAQWKALSGGVNPTSPFNTEASGCNDNCPVEQVSWWSAVGFLNALSAAEGLPACYVLPNTCTGTWQAGTLFCPQETLSAPSIYACTGYRLPTEAEWEFAARAGTTTATYGGNLTALSSCMTLGGAGIFANGTPLSALARYACDSQGPMQVGKRAANAWGLYDMLGSVYEWVYDRFGPYPGTVTDPVGASAGASVTDDRVIRGGAWIGVDKDLRAAAREYWRSDLVMNNLGFRAARTAF